MHINSFCHAAAGPLASICLTFRSAQPIMVLRLRLNCEAGMESEEERRFREFLSESGLKFTQERRMVLKEVFANHNHFEADDLVMGLRDKGYRVSRASVYRTLPLLVGSGLLREVHSDEKHSHYEHTFGHDHHDHLICTECGKTIEFANDEIEELQDRVCAALDFVPRSHKLEIIGVCSECNARPSEAHQQS